jgi:membrane-associated phospholipid phosphatase
MLSTLNRLAKLAILSEPDGPTDPALARRAAHPEPLGLRERSLRFSISAVLAAIAFVILAAAAHLGLLRALDRQLLDLIQSVARPQLDLIGSVVTVFGQSEVTVGIAAGLVVARVRARRADFWMPLAIAIIVALEAVAKLVVAQPLPPHDVQRDLGLFPGVVVPFAHSFPSGHVARDAFLLLIVHGWPRVAVGLALTLVAVSRVYIGQHWPSDVVGGLLLGAAVAWVGRGRPQAPIRSTT